MHDAKLIRYANEFVIVTRLGNADDLLGLLKRYLPGGKLKLDEAKTRVADRVCAWDAGSIVENMRREKR